MDTIVLECGHKERDFVVADFTGKNILGITMDASPDGLCRIQAFLADGEPVDELLAELAAYKPVHRIEPDVDWVAAVHASWEPQDVGEHLFLAPSWRNDEAPPGRLRLEIPPGGASGTGLHAATQIALRAIERLVQPGAAFLDIGTGSGILAAAACQLGAGQIIACDIDEQAVDSAADYLHSRRVPAMLFAGSCRSLRPGVADVAAVNIGARAIAGLANSIAACLKPGGRAILTGFTTDQASLLEKPLAEAALRVADTLVAEEWVGLIVEV
jgi:ribosomal protein L11 methyltransferase